MKIPAGTKIIKSREYEKTRAKTIEIPEGVDEIGEYAFAFSNTLEKVIIPKTVRKIGHKAFYRCFKLSEIIIPEGIEHIEPHTFEGCNFKSVLIPHSVLVIDDNAQRDQPICI